TEGSNPAASWELPPSPVLQGRVKLILYGAQIGTRVDLRDAAFTNPGGLALDFERLNTPALYLLP
ncbi:hypothetical protein ACFC18_51665, partial [Streptomyces sp. NPDC056121]|uniref:hypothetical protein n=1 Tax=Streptomyces sp. NPDC056121 TaxID=3345718 RepID=UPI0035E24DE8